MKNISIVLALSCLVAFGGTVSDQANVFGPQASEVSKAIAELPVWFETRVQTPEQGLKIYADDKIATLTNRGFLVLITTQPRAWRISMTPQGMVSSEATRLAGDAMTVKFKQGKFKEGAIGLAEELVNLSKPNKAEAETDWHWLLLSVAGVIVLLFVAVALIVWRSSRRERIRKEAERAEREMAEFRSRSEARERESEHRARSAEYDESLLTQAQRRKAKKLFEQYTPEQRRSMAQPYLGSTHSDGLMDSPFFWWWLMSTNNAPCCHSAAAHHSEPSQSYVAPSRHEAPSYSPPSSSWDSGSSSSDSGGSSYSSSDSGSSYDSGSSSSDSGGSSGSW